MYLRLAVLLLVVDGRYPSLLDVLGTFQGLTKINNRSGPTSAGTPAGPGIPLCEREIPMPKSRPETEMSAVELSSQRSQRTVELVVVNVDVVGVGMHDDIDRQ